MSKSLLTAKIAGGAVLGTGAVAAGGYGIVEHFKSKESNTTPVRESNPVGTGTVSVEPSNPAPQPALPNVEGQQNTTAEGSTAVTTDSKPQPLEEDSKGDSGTLAPEVSSEKDQKAPESGPTNSTPTAERTPGTDGASSGDSVS